MAANDSVQAEVLKFLDTPEAYPPGLANIERMETHASVVFLAGDYAYKVKRAVKYPFLDFSTLEKRRAAALNELRVNARTAPDLYLDVIPVVEDSRGRLRLGGEGRPVEWVLRMRRFEQAMLFDRMAGEGRLELAAMPALAAVIEAFHRGADRALSPEFAVKPHEAVLGDSELELAANSDVLPPQRVADFSKASRARLAALVPLLEARTRGGYVRHCHGDLHLRNIVEIEGKPVLFDAIEFDDRIATNDVLYDLAFLLMDLGKRGLRAHANAVLNAYLDAEGGTGNLIGLATLPLFLAMRAGIRAKVDLLRARAGAKASASATTEQGSTYFALGEAFLAPQAPHLVAIGGLSGSGKSAVTRAIAPFLGAFPGAVIVRSDVERKRLFGVAAETRLGSAAYAAEVSDPVYAMTRKRSTMALLGGQAVIVDAVHVKPAERDAIAALAGRLGVRFTGLWLEAPAQVMRERVASRKGDVSDASAAVVDEQLSYDLGRQSFTPIDASLPLDDVAAGCLEQIAGMP
jgi:uncharacterized protein